MNEKLFDELAASIREAGAIRRGEAEPARSTRFDDIDVRAIRDRFRLSQPQFAAMLGISVGTLRGWEQGRRYPEGPARVLLRVAESHPDAVLSVTQDLYSANRPASAGWVTSDRRPSHGEPPPADPQARPVSNANYPTARRKKQK
jgi:putative transcriptional regulator